MSVDMVTSGTDTGSAGELRQVVAAAQSGDTIEFDPSVSTVSLSLGNIQISQTHLTIAGPGASSLTIDGGSVDTIFTVIAGSDLSISGLTLTHGDSQSGEGGAIYNNLGGTLSVSNVNFTSNVADQGGAIDNDGSATVDQSLFSGNSGAGAAIFTTSDLTVTNSTFTSNTSNIGGGAIYNQAGTLTASNDVFAGNQALRGGALENDDTAFLTNCTFTSNSVPTGGTGGGLGGAIFTANNITITGGTFTGNTANSGGGAIYNVESLTIAGATFTHNNGDSANTGTTDGGAIFTEGTATIDGSTFTNNTAGFGGAIFTDFTLWASRINFNNNTAPSGDGGAVANAGGANISDSSFSSNSAVNGGGFYNFNGGLGTLVNSTLYQNSATGFGGGAYNDGASTLESVNSTIAKNSAFSGGGGLDIEPSSGGDATIYNTIVSGNFLTAPPTPGTPSDILGTLDEQLAPDFTTASSNNLIGDAASAGGLANGSNNNLVVANAGLDPTGLHSNGSAQVSTLALTSSSQAIDNGSNSLAYDAAGNALVTDERGYYRIFNALGGPTSNVDIGAYEYQAPQGPTLLKVNTTLDFVAYNTSGLFSLRQAIGFANYSDGAPSITFDSTIFNATTPQTITPENLFNFNNVAAPLTITGPGANALTLSGNSNNTVLNTGTGSSVTISGVTIARGFSLVGNGGGIENAGNLTLTNCTFSNNEAPTGEGGAIFNSGTLTLNTDTFNNNIAHAGGAIVNHGTLFLNGGTFDSNQADSGGAISNNNEFFGNGGTFTNNHATDGGAIDVEGASNMSLTGATFGTSVANTGNTAVDGGAIFNNGNSNISDCTFTGDTSINAGGAISGAGNLTISSCSFINDSTSGNAPFTSGGGAIFAVGGNLNVSGSLFQNDSAPQAPGGGIYNFETSTIIGCTFDNDYSGATPGGGGIYNANIINVSDSTFSANHADNGGGGGFYNDGGNVTLVNCTFASNYSSAGAGGGLYNTNHGALTITNSTFSLNYATSGGGIFNEDAMSGSIDAGGNLTLYNTIVSGNTLNDLSTASDLTGPLDQNPGVTVVGTVTVTQAASTHNYYGGNAMLAPLGNYGGPTNTMPPLPGSPVIDMGDTAQAVDGNMSPLLYDQRGQPRVVGSFVDIGAVEVGGYTLVAVNGNTQSTDINTAFTSPLSVRVKALNLLDPVTGAMISYSAPVTGASIGSLIGATAANSSGFVAPTALANGTGGTYQVTATFDGQNITFTLTNLAPTTVEFIQQPTNTIAGQTITPAVTVEVLDQFGALYTGTLPNVILSVNSGPGPLLGTLSEPVSGGIATFSDLSIHTAGTYTLLATNSALSAVSNSFVITAAAPAKLVYLQQPASTTIAGQTFSTVVAVEDQFNNIELSDNNTVGLSINTGPAAVLNGTTNLALNAGIATFTGLSINTAGTYTLLATDTGDSLTQPSNPFTITPAAPFKLVYLQQPADSLAGQSFSTVVAVEDQYDNIETADSNTIALTINSGPSTTLNGTTSLALSAGMATFTGLSINTAGSYTLLAADGAESFTAISNPFTITAAAPAKVVYLLQPSNSIAGQSFTTVVAVEDQFNNIELTDNNTIVLAINSGPSNALNGVTSLSLNAGIATFTGLSINTAGTYTLLASDSAETLSGVSNPFAITPAAASKVVYLLQPANSLAGQSFTTVVAVEDQFNNIETSDSNTIALSINSGPSTTLNGTISRPLSAGVATFTALSINTAGSYTLLAADGVETLSATSNPFAITAAAPAKVVYLIEPSNSIAGQSFTTAVAVEDQFNNIELTDNNTIALTINSGPSSALNGTTSLALNAGVATFNDLSINTAGTYTLLASDSAETLSAVSNPFAITPAAASKLVYLVQPANSLAGQSFTTVVAVEDQYNNIETADNNTIALSINSGPSSTLNGTTSLPLSSGVATFSTLSINTAGTFTLLAADGVESLSATSNPFTISASAPAKLVYLVQPANTTAGQSFSTVVAVEDQFNNIEITDNNTVALSINSGPSTSLNGTTSLALNAGVATFSPLSINTAGTYTLLASDNSEHLSAVSNSFAISAAAAAKLVYVVQPANSLAGQSFTTVVAVEDQYNNIESNDSNVIAVSINSGPSSTLNGSANLALTNGVASFTTLSINTAGTYTLLSSDTAESLSAVSSPFAITPAAAAKLVYIVQPPTTLAGEDFSTVVAVEDQFNNIESNDNNTIALSINSGPTSVLNGTTSTALVNGQATFTTLSINTAGTFTLLAADTADSLSAVSSPFDILAVAATNIDLSITNTVDNSTPNVGSNVTYTITVSNANGFATATNISISDMLPAGLTLVSSNPSSGAYSGGVWTIPAVLSGDSATLTFIAMVNAFAPQTTTATITAADQSETGTQLSASATINPQEVDLSITKSVNNSTPNVGDNVTYTVTVSNASGYSTASGVSISDLLPSGETLVSSSTANYSGGVWSLGNISAGGSVTLTYVATVNVFASQTNTATISSAAQSDVGTALSATVTVNPQEIDLSIAKSVNNSTPNVGSNITYTVTVSNASGYSTASGVSISDLLPSGETLVSSSTTNFSGGVWSLGSLAGGSSATLTYVAKVNAFAPQTNTAAITTAAQTEIGTALSSTVTVNPQEIDLSIAKSVNNSTPNVGANVTYTVTVSNASGYSTASGISISDLLPSGETLVSSSTTNFSGGIWSLGSLTAGNSATLTYVATVNAFAPQTNTATITSAAQTDISSALSSTVTVNPQEIDLSIAKSVNNSTPNVGSNITYTVTVSNASGYSTASGVSISDLLPSGETLVSSSTTNFSGGIWSLGSLASGSSATLTYVAMVNAFAPQTNTATITTAAQTEIGTALSSTVTVNPQEIDLSIAKSVNNSTPNVGSNVTYTVTVSNASGYSTASGISISDLLPSGETLVSSSTTNFSGGVWSLASLAAGSSASLTYVAKVNIFAPQTNTATITTAAQTEVGTALASSVTVNPQEIDLAVTKTVNNSTPNVGANVTYTITVSNASGYTTATGITLTDVLPAGETLVSSSTASSSFSGGTWTLGSLAGGSTASLTYVAKVNAFAPQTNTASVNPTAQTDIGTALSATVTVNPQEIDLSIAKSVNNSAPNVGSNITYTVTVSNASGYSAASGVSITDLLPSGETLVSSSTTNFSGGIWSLGSLTAGNTATLTYVATVNAFAPQTNTATITTAAQTEIGTALSASVTVNPQEIDLSITKSVNNTTPSVGSNITYTVTVSNASGYTTASGVSITDVLPTGETLVSSSSTNFNGSLWSLGSLAGGSTASITYVAKVNISTPQTNTASINATSQTDIGSPLTASVTINPQQSAISGTVYNDITGNGLSADDTALAGVVINAYNDVSGSGVYNSNDGAAVATLTSASNGAYSFTNLAPGKYVITETVPSGYVETAPNLPNSYAATLAGGVFVTHDDFDNFHVPVCPLNNVYYTIGNCGTQITNLRGSTAQGETVTAHFTVPSTSAPMVYTLVSYNAPSPVFDATVASEQMIYQVDSETLGPGTHTLTVTIPNNYYQIDFVCGAAIDKLGPAGSNIFYSAQSRLDSADNGGCNAIYVPATIGDFVWNDLNGNGIQDSNEPGISGVTVKLLNSGGSVLATATTNSAGNYSFTNLAAGQYVVQFTAPSGMVFTTQHVGTNNAVDSDPSQSTGKTNTITLANGQNDNSEDAGLSQPATIGDFVWVDSNGNGLQDAGETGFNCVTVKLLSATNGSVVATTTTNAQGYYSFTNLVPGQYVVQITAPSGWAFTSQGVGTNPAINSSVNQSTGKSATVTLLAGQTNDNIDAGMYKTACLSGNVFVDYTNNSVENTGDSGLSGVTVQLLNGNGQTVATATTASDGTYSFSNIAPGNYSVYEAQGQTALRGCLFTKDTPGTVGGVTDGSVVGIGTGVIGGVSLISGASGQCYNFGHSASGQTLTAGDTGSLNFWSGSNGRQLILSLNGSQNATALGNWLATNFPNLYGHTCSSYNMTGKNNSQVYVIFQNLVRNANAQLNAQVLACGFNMYVTDSNHAGTVATTYGFNVEAGGCGNKMFNDWSDGSAFGTGNYAVLSVTQIIDKCNAMSTNGNFYNGNGTLQWEASNVFVAINQAGDVGADV